LKPFIVSSREITNSCPVVDGALLDIATESIMDAKGFIVVSKKVALDPIKFEQYAIGYQFHHSRQEAENFLLKQYETAIKRMTLATKKIMGKREAKA
jgi:hypothetical protein